jgi:hypothetical protein
MPQRLQRGWKIGWRRDRCQAVSELVNRHDT